MHACVCARCPPADLVAPARASTEWGSHGKGPEGSTPTIWMEHLAHEAHARRLGWVLFPKGDAQGKDAPCDGGACVPRGLRVSQSGKKGFWARSLLWAPDPLQRGASSWSPARRAHSPSHAVSSGPKIVALQTKRLDSSAGLALQPAGGSVAMARRSLMRRSMAAEGAAVAMACRACAVM